METQVFSRRVNDFEKDICEVLITEGEIAQRVAELGAKITTDYAERLPEGESLILVGVLKGVTVFIADLLRQLKLPVELYFIDFARHSADTRETGIIELSATIGDAIEGKQVLFVEDIVDAGLTLSYMSRILALRNPSSFEVCTMFNKKENRVMDIPIKYVGYELPNRYVVGYGLDYKERFRNLPYIGILDKEAF